MDWSKTSKNLARTLGTGKRNPAKNAGSSLVVRSVCFKFSSLKQIKMKTSQFDEEQWIAKLDHTIE